MAMDAQLLLDLSTALGIGLLIGAERGWRAREDSDDRLSAGVRTFGLIGLLGGVAALLASTLGTAVWIAILLALAALVTASYVIDALHNDDPGMTTEIALLLTFGLGSLAVSGERLLASGLAVVITLLLWLKEPLHAALKRLSAAELAGALKLLFISLVLLPVLPDQGYGPWNAFNPARTWWMVVLLAALGFAAYVAMRMVGTRHGLILTAMLGSLVSSTAMTLTLARLHARHSLRPLLAAGLLATSAVMFPRVLLEVAAVHPPLLAQLMPCLLATAAVYGLGAAYWWIRSSRCCQDDQAASEPILQNPFELAPALRFAALLALILLLVEFARHELGETGLYAVALLSGLTDVDAITLSLSRSASEGLASEVAVRGIMLAVFANSLIKALLIIMAGNAALAVRTLPVMLAGMALGLGMTLF